MRFLLDTNACIHLLRAAAKPGRVSSAASAIRARMDATDAAGSESFLCSVVLFELVAGAIRSEHPERNRDEVATFVGAFRSLPFNDAAARHAADVSAALASVGTPIGPNDLFIAGIALANDLILITHNTAEFRRVPGLTIEDWERSQ